MHSAYKAFKYRIVHALIKDGSIKNSLNSGYCFQHSCGYILHKTLFMPVHDDRHKRLFQFIFGALLWLLILYAILDGIMRLLGW